MWKWFQRLCWPPKAAEPTESTISSTSECKTYRVQGVPIRCDKAKLEQILNKEPDKKNFKIKSLVLEYHGRHQNATVDALDGAELPAYINVSSATSQAADRPEIQLQTDDNFHGLTTLFAPLEEEHEVDVVAICGLGGHAIGSFRHRESHHIWLRDALPHDLTAEHSDRPMARLMTYGYESKVAGSKNTQQLGDLASGLRETLGALQGSRPLIFIAHSLGGLIIKEAIISLNKLDTTEYNMLLQRIRGIIFFAVPHAGMNIESMVSMVGGGYNLSLVVSLSDVNSKVLDDQRVEFKKALDNKKNIEVFCFYELLASPTAIKVAADKWELRGEEEVLLKKTSATDCRSGGDGLDHVCPIRASHSNIVKFRQNDPEYDRALHKIKEVCYRALGARDIPPVQDVHFIVPYPRNRSFVGRKKVLTKIKETLELRKRPEARKYTKLALHGLGGIGKTQIAIAFAYWVRDKYQHISVLWVHASSEDRFRRAYEKIAKAYNIPGHNDPRTDILVLVRDYLTLKERKQWIMIIDNADDSELFFSSGADDMGMPSDRGLSQYIPNCAHGTTLLTTRTKKAGLNFVPGQGHLLIEIGVLEPDGARQLVQQTLGSDKVTADQASSLSESLENLPLALAQALAYMEANSMAIEEYQTLLREGEVVLVDQFCQHFPSDKRDEDMPNAVAAAWVISFEQISKTDPLAAEFLSIMSLLDRQAILEDFFVTYQSQKRKSNPSKRWEYEDKKARIESLGTLIAYSFITKSMQNTYDMHRLVHLVTRRWLVQKGMFDKFASLATSIMLDACPQPVWDNIGLFAKILPHTRAVVGHQAVLEGAFIERAEILYRMGWYLLRTSQLADAERCTAESQRLFEEHLGASHHDTLWAFHLRLQIYTDQGKFPEAVTLAEEALAQAQDGDDGAILAITRISASVYRRMGNLEKAEEKLQSCLKTAKAKLGDEHDQTLFCLYALAQVHIDQGRLNESQTILDIVIAARKRLKGNEHLDTLATMHDLARLHACRGKFQDAAELNKRVWQLRTYKLGDDNAHTLASQNNYACNLRSLGRHHTAVEVMQDCELRQIRVWGPDHPKALIAQSLVQQWSVQVNSHGLQH